ncbi:MAG TPA: ATPase, T2SS/T4P/T4SS family, partial [Burkholderiales bacterium]|nr:ATPase, T2SS/T4P/T4SS family [Burkholderiales bacterium]
MIAPSLVEKARAAGGAKMIESLEEALACPPAEFVRELARTVLMPVATLEDLRGEKPEYALVPHAEASRRGCIALRAADGTLSVVLGDPYDLDTQDWLEARGAAQGTEPFRYRLAHRLDIATYLSEQEHGLRALDGIPLAVQAEAAFDRAQDISFESAAQGDSTVVRLVTSTLYDALKAGASDVHLESTGAGLAIKYRVDGVLTAAQSVPGSELAEQVISRIKVMSELDIAERRVPQDGRFKARHRNGTEAGREIDFRVSVIPSALGEDAVLRILDRRALSDQLSGLSLDALGFASNLKIQLRDLAAQP